MASPPKGSSGKRTDPPRLSDGTRQFRKDWERLTRSIGRAALGAARFCSIGTVRLTSLLHLVVGLLASSKPACSLRSSAAVGGTYSFDGLTGAMVWAAIGPRHLDQRRGPRRRWPGGGAPSRQGG